jgi:hypothetical protein
MGKSSYWSREESVCGAWLSSLLTRDVRFRRIANLEVAILAEAADKLMR